MPQTLIMPEGMLRNPHAEVQQALPLDLESGIESYLAHMQTGHTTLPTCRLVCMCEASDDQFAYTGVAKPGAPGLLGGAGGLQLLLHLQPARQLRVLLRLAGAGGAGVATCGGLCMLVNGQVRW